MKINSNSIIDAGFDIVFENSGIFEISLKDITKPVVFSTLPNTKIDVFINDYSSKNHIIFHVNQSSCVNLHLISTKKETDFEILGDVKYDGIFNIYFADFSNENTNLKSNIILFGENANSEFKFSSIATKGIKKFYDIGFDHLGRKSNSNFEGYGVALQDGEINAKGISHIEKNSIKSYANQMVKVILFDKQSKAKASPVLKIDCDDIIANHACAIGSLNEDHVFYLKSRGLSEEEARRLITLGYLIPIENYFDESRKKVIESYIKESF